MTRTKNSADTTVALAHGEDAVSDSPTEKQTRSWPQKVVHEVRTHPFGYTVLVLFILAGPILAPFLFPKAPPATAAAGGLVFGLYAALCAVPQKFL